MYRLASNATRVDRPHHVARRRQARAIGRLPGRGDTLRTKGGAVRADQDHWNTGRRRLRRSRRALPANKVQSDRNGGDGEHHDSRRNRRPPLPVSLARRRRRHTSRLRRRERGVVWTEILQCAGEALLQRLSECHARGVPILGLLRKRLGEHGTQPRQLRDPVGDRRRWRREVLTDDDCRIGVLERLLSGQEMKGRRRERVLIGSAVDRLTHELFRRGVRDSSDGHVRRGQPHSRH